MHIGVESGCKIKELGYDVDDVSVYLEIMELEDYQFCKSKSLRQQYELWRNGKIQIGGNEKKTVVLRDSGYYPPPED